MNQIENRPIRPIDKLESFENGEQVLQLLSFQKNFKTFLLTIKNIIGASLVVHPDGETSIAFKGKLIEETKKKRFDDYLELHYLLKMAELT